MQHESAASPFEGSFDGVKLVQRQHAELQARECCSEAYEDWEEKTSDVRYTCIEEV